MNDINLMQERTERYITALTLGKPDRVPHETRFGEYWALEYAGFNIKTDTVDAHKMGQAMERIAQDFATDTCPSLFTRNPLFYKMLQSQCFVQSESGIMQHPEVSFMKDEEYPMLIENPLSFIIEKILPRAYRSLDGTPAETMTTLLKAMNAKTDMSTPLLMETVRVSNTYQLPLTGAGLVEAPLDYIADMIRGFSKISLDIRRQKSLVKNAAQAVLPLMVKFASMLPPVPGRTIGAPLHMPVFMRNKDFEELYWPTFKALIEDLTGKGYQMKIYFEGDWTRFYDYLQDLPQGKIIGCFEYMDPVLCKDKLGKVMCISCGYDVSLLEYGTKMQVVDEAKRILDALAPGGGHIFSVSKGITFSNDGKAENVKALYDFVSENGKY